MTEPKIYGPFWPYNKRGLPLVMKNGIPAWMVAEPRAADGRTFAEKKNG